MSVFFSSTKYYEIAIPALFEGADRNFQNFPCNIIRKDKFEAKEKGASNGSEDYTQDGTVDLKGRPAHTSKLWQRNQT
ncbi:hypothetical protein RND71_013992 [Anisodus tanguticus]|uniref:Uncharacterized protein n=1 Tax=Anisodus tanguticus TaxID=243964 RepID=A0AAE1VEP5_9SOLA|nr:hypothetical protein RND71_013992 [Anisodus tanguticus]